MRKGSSSSAAAKATNANTSSTTTKRKEIGGGGDRTVVAAAVDSSLPPSSILPKKGRYKEEHSVAMTTQDAKSLKPTAVRSNGTTATSSGKPVVAVPQNHVQFTFGALPEIIGKDDEAFFKATIIICKRTTLQQILSEGDELLNSMLGMMNASTNILQSMCIDCGGSKSSTKGVSVSSTYVDHDCFCYSNPDSPMSVHKLYLMTVPDEVSRCNHSWSVHSVSDAIRATVGGGGSSSSCRIVCCGTSVAQVMGSLTASIARAFSVYTRKTTKKMASDDESESPMVPRIHISFMDVSDSGIQESIPANNGDHLLYLCESIQLAARLADMPPEELTTTAYADECRQMAASLQNVTYNEIVGDDLDRLGYGGLYGIGKAATCPPRLVIIEYIPDTTYDECIALVGKGIVYDTGGLSLKSKDGMPGMKYDMGGSAGVFGGFVAAVKMKLPKRIVLILCLAENAIGPNAVRNDDILTMYSGKTVEVNNTDAEGRLVLADGVAHASQHLEDCTLILDMATLTGAQLVAAGKTHAGILANSIALEHRIVEAGLKSGDLVVPLLYAPELLLKEFESKVADMKNSVKDRSNAQASCAGHFIEAHLSDAYSGGWIHVDMAGPADKDGRSTGYGVALVLALLNAPGF